MGSSITWKGEKILVHRRLILKPNITLILKNPESDKIKKYAVVEVEMKKYNKKELQLNIKLKIRSKRITSQT